MSKMDEMFSQAIGEVKKTQQIVKKPIVLVEKKEKKEAEKPIVMTCKKHGPIMLSQHGMRLPDGFYCKKCMLEHNQAEIRRHCMKLE